MVLYPNIGGINTIRVITTWKISSNKIYIFDQQREWVLKKVKNI